VIRTALIALAALTAPVVAAASGATPAIYERVGWLMSEFRLPVLRDDPRGPDRLQVFAGHELRHWNQFAVADVMVARQGRVRTVWISDASRRVDNPMWDGEQRRPITPEAAYALMDAVAANAARPPHPELVCIDGPMYHFVMRRDGVVTSGTLDWCGYDDTDDLVRLIFSGTTAPGLAAVWVRP
jgi:hypothetical protein